MISISSKNVSLITKVGLLVLAVYVVGFFIVKGANYYKTSYQKEVYIKELREKKAEIKDIKEKIQKVKEKTQQVKNSYITQDELAIKVTDVFERFSLLDYDLKYLNSKQMCVDRHILIVQLVAQSDKGLKAGEGILSYLGEVKKSDNNDTIYFVDYISKAKDK